MLYPIRRPAESGRSGLASSRREGEGGRGARGRRRFCFCLHPVRLSCCGWKLDGRWPMASLNPTSLGNIKAQERGYVKTVECLCA